jgi:hypothetical protein
VPSSGLECGSEVDELEREGLGSEAGTVVSQFSHVSRELVEARLALTEGGFMDFLEGLRCRTVAGLDSCSFQNELPISR